MNFNHVKLPFTLTEMVAKTIEGERVYPVSEDKFYPSITTITSYRTRHVISEWRRRVGNEEANKISTQASSVGTSFHSMAEDYLNNNFDIEKYKDQYMAKVLFIQAKPILNRINNIHFQEAPLFSHEYGIAGRVDCIGEFDGKLYVIDFKTSSKEKKEEWIENYFVQETGYAKMYEERSGIKVDQIVTLIACQSGEPQIFIKNPSDYVPLLVDYIKEYRERNDRHRQTT